MTTGPANDYSDRYPPLPDLGRTRHRNGAAGVIRGMKLLLTLLLLALTSGAGCALVPASDALTSPAVTTATDLGTSTSGTSSGTPPAWPGTGPAHIDVPSGWLTRTEVPFEPPPPVEEQPPDLDLSDDVILDEMLLFTVGSAVLSADADAVLEPLAAQALKRLGPDQNLWIGGYVDEQGDAAFNKVLAQNRADAVRARIIRLQPALEGRIIAVGHGEDDLLHPDCRGDCQANRAVVVRLDS